MQIRGRIVFIDVETSMEPGFFVQIEVRKNPDGLEPGSMQLGKQRRVCPRER